MRTTVTIIKTDDGMSVKTSEVLEVMSFYHSLVLAALKDRPKELKLFMRKFRERFDSDVVGS